MFYRRLLILCSIGVLFAGLLTASDRRMLTMVRSPDEVLRELKHFWLTAYNTPSQQSSMTLKKEILAKAEPDECYHGIGQPYSDDPPCAEGLPKVNQAYVWGLAKSGHNLWFGTLANAHCMVLGEFLGMFAPHEIDLWVCEYGSSQFSPPLRAHIGDWRSPQIFVYNTQDKSLTEKTPEDPLINSTVGIRSAGAHNNVAILAGPGLKEEGAINLFAFNTETGTYLGSKHLDTYSNIRKWLVVDDVLYTAVGDTGRDRRGSVLRWTGDATDPFQAEVVGTLDGDGLELAEHDGRLFVATWPNASIWMSPTISSGGLTTGDADRWEKVWQAADYEPDSVTASSYGGGAMASFDGYLYWGTMHIPFVSLTAHFNFYGTPTDSAEMLAAILGTYRVISIFRGRNFGTAEQEIDLLYGTSELPTFVPDVGWEIRPNNMGTEPLWGLAGFDNFYNNYTWTMAAYDDQLYVGTMDWSILLQEELVESIFPLFSEIPLELPPSTFGADLYRFPSSDSKALPESVDGVGNFANYGVRTMISDDYLYLGMANPMNLMTDPQDDLPEGGWELLKLAAIDTSCIIGDVNCDKHISPADALCTFWRSILGEWQPECACQCSEQSVDVNCDGNVTPGDALCIFWRSILGDWQEECVCPVLKPSEEPGAFRIFFGRVRITPGQMTTVPLLVDSPRNLDAFRLHLVYPIHDLEFVDILPSQATRDWIIVDGAEVDTGSVILGGFHTKPLSSEGNVSIAEIMFRARNDVKKEYNLDIVEACDDLSGPVCTTLGVDIHAVPEAYTLAQNCPNPFNPTTTIHYTLPAETRNTEYGIRMIPVHTILQVFNLLGQEVKTLVDMPQEPGYYSVTWDGRDNGGGELPSGIYFYRIQTNSFTAVRRMVLLK